MVKAFCVCLSLQAGTIGLSVIGLTLMVCTFMFNLFATNDMHNESIKALEYGLLYTYLIIMCVAYVLAFLGTFWEKPGFLKNAAIALGGGFLIYVILSIVSFVVDVKAITAVCVNFRCPDHHWLQDGKWRRELVGNATLPQPDYGDVETLIEEYDVKEDGDPEDSWDDESTPGGTRHPARRKRQGETASDTTTNAVSPAASHPTVAEYPDVTGGENTTNNHELHRKHKMFIVVSVLHTILIFIFFSYTIVIFVAFATQLKEEELEYAEL